MGSGEWGVGSGEWGVGCGVWGVGCGVWGVGCGVWGETNLLRSTRGSEVDPNINDGGVEAVGVGVRKRDILVYQTFVIIISSTINFFFVVSIVNIR